MKLDDDRNVFPRFTYHGFSDGDVEEPTKTVAEQFGVFGSQKWMYPTLPLCNSHLFYFY